MYGKFIKQSSYKELGEFTKTTIDKNAQIKTDKWQGYAPLSRDFVDSREEGNNFLDLYRCILSFKDWLRGMHHKDENLHSFLNTRQFYEDDITIGLTEIIWRKQFLINF